MTNSEIVCFGGRCFVYPSGHDRRSRRSSSFKTIVSGIPTDFNQYKAWLKQKREFYAMLTGRLEKELLTITEDKMQHELTCEANDTLESFEYRCITLDRGLSRLPTALCNLTAFLPIDWIDLDNELFSTNNRASFLDLWNSSRRDIPREAVDGVKPPTYFDTASEYDGYNSIYKQYKHFMVKAISDFDLFEASTKQTLGIILFEKITFLDEVGFGKYLPGWSHKSFAFREVAFAILSLAANQYYFDELDRFCGIDRFHENQGYLIDPNKHGNPKLMPVFASGCHSPSQEPGSAPPGSIYWFENVLISLVPDEVFECESGAAIAKAVEYGVAEGKRNFQLIVFSILNAIMVEVHVKDGVVEIRRTGVMAISKPGWRGWVPIDQIDHSKTPEQVCSEYPGFIALQNYFAIAANRHLSVFGQGLFSTEIYGIIVANADISTRNNCAKASTAFSNLCQDHFSFISDLTIVMIENRKRSTGDITQLRLHVSPRHKLEKHNTTWSLSRDRRIVDMRESKLHVSSSQKPRRHDSKIKAWSPVIGEGGRPSIIPRIRLRFLLDPSREVGDTRETKRRRIIS